MTPQDPVDRHLERLGRATRALEPSPGFVQRVMDAAQSVQLSESAWWQLVAGPARWFVPTTALLALLALGWAYQARGTLDESLAVALGTETYVTLLDEP